MARALYYFLDGNKPGPIALFSHDREGSLAPKHLYIQWHISVCNGDHPTQLFYSQWLWLSDGDAMEGISQGEAGGRGKREMMEDMPTGRKPWPAVCLSDCGGIM